MRTTLAVLLACAACATSAPPAADAPASTSPQTSPASTATSAPAPTAAKAPENTSELLAQQRAPFDACYAQARKARPDLGRTNVEITFTREGAKLASVDLKYRNRWDEAAKDCMRAAAEALSFPSTLDGTQTGTIVFSPP